MIKSRRHVNPYGVHDPRNIFEICENSSHPELFDRRRIYKYRGHTFQGTSRITAARECQKYLEDHGVDVYDCKLTPVRQLDSDGSVIIVCHIIDRFDRIPAGQEDIRELVSSSLKRLGYG